MVAISNKRKERDLMKLMMSNYEVNMSDEGRQFDFYVKFQGPKESAYEGVNYFLILGNMENSCYFTRSISLQISF
jgi:ubiquitin-protein ligase